jgi:hypothetical protein
MGARWASVGRGSARTVTTTTSKSARFGIAERERYPFSGTFLKTWVTNRSERGWIGERSVRL